MKFGQDLKNNIVPEWEHGYIAYDALKELIKKISTVEAPARNEAVEEEFFMLLEEELEKVNRFYLEKVNEFEAELTAIMERATRKEAPATQPLGGPSSSPPGAAASAAASSTTGTTGDDDDDHLMMSRERGPPGTTPGGTTTTTTITTTTPEAGFLAHTAKSTTQASLVQLHGAIGQLQAFVWLNTQGFEKIMKKYDKFTGLRHTKDAKTPDFEARLRNEAFKSDRLETCLERFKLARSRVNNEAGAGVELKLISGSANKPLAEEISARLGVPLSPAKVRRFNDGEVNIQLCDSVRGCSVFIVQPTCPPVNDHLIELLLLISAARRASAASVTAVVPYYGYARQDRKDRSRVPISAADVARMMEAMGVDRVVCVDLHCAQIQGFFGPRTPVDNLYAAPIAVSYFNLKDLHSPVIVSPDAGGVARAKLFMEGFAKLPDPPEVSLAVILKQRAAAGVVASMHLVGNVEGADCIIVDDMIDTAGTLTNAANELKNLGAARVFAFATHGLFSGPAADRIEACVLEEVVVANTVPVRPEITERTRKIRQLSVGKLVEGAIRGIHCGTSVSALFDANVGADLIA